MPKPTIKKPSKPKPSPAENQIQVTDAEPVTPKTPINVQALCSECRHSDTLHYGSAERWCNLSGCKCLAFR